jgi:hypothetical protein
MSKERTIRLIACSLEMRSLHEVSFACRFSFLLSSLPKHEANIYAALFLCFFSMNIYGSDALAEAVPDVDSFLVRRWLVTGKVQRFFCILFKGKE